jgi:hypothetical protein
VFCTRLLATKKNQPRVPVVQASTVLNEFNTSLLQVTFNIAVQWFSTVEYLFQHDHCRWSNKIQSTDEIITEKKKYTDKVAREVNVIFT